MDSGSADLWVGAEGCQSEDGGDCVSVLLTALYLESIFNLTLSRLELGKPRFPWPPELF